MITYHTPVLLHQTLEGLALQPDGRYADATFGGGGHAQAILDQLGPEGRLVGFDKDGTAAGNEPADKRFQLVNHDYAYIANFIRYLDLVPLDGILADLGVASHHLDTANRGFTYRAEAPLDMRMDQDNATTAAHLLNSASPDALQRILGQYGEVKNARQVAQSIVEARQQERLTTTGQLTDVLQRTIHGQDKLARYQSQVFQALRIAVNEELSNLKAFLQAAVPLLRPGGRLAVMTYHSLEDRLVKHFFRAGNFTGKPQKDIYGQELAPLEPVTRKPLLPSDAEIAENPRARSAKLRLARKKAEAPYA
jgi:16S rRNA (cytosine1402-N4)-methyltransferase